MEKSAIVEHAWAEQYHPLWEEISILEQADRDDVLRPFALPLLNTRRASTEIRELQSLIVGSHCCCTYGEELLVGILTAHTDREHTTESTKVTLSFVTS